MNRKKIVVLSGAGISAESGISTFRDAGGLWEGHDIMEVASPQGWAQNPSLVLDFYNKRRKQLKEVEPNDGHKTLVALETHYEVVIVTQNVDDLHERAGSTNIIHLHGELKKGRSSIDKNKIWDIDGDINVGDLASDGSQIRPHIVWFGEEVPALELAIDQVRDADILIVVGTSLQVYPAASLIGYAPRYAKIYYVDPNPHISFELSVRSNLSVINEVGSVGLGKVLNELVPHE